MGSEATEPPSGKHHGLCGVVSACGSKRNGRPPSDQTTSHEVTQARLMGQKVKCH